MISQNFVYLKFDHLIFVNKKIKLIISIYVDDLLIIESKKFKKIDNLKRAMSKRFVMIDLNFCYYYLNITMTRDRFKKTLYLSQKTYIEKIIKRFDINICKTFAISLKTSTKLKFDAKYKITIKKIKIYQAIVECLIYLVFQTRFDIVFAIQKLTRFNLNSTKIAHETTKKLFRYLQNIKNLNITYEQNEKLINYIDVDYIENSIIKKSTKIYIFSLHENVFN